MKMSSKSFMNTDSHNQRLFDDGIHKEDYIAHKSWYQQCGECNTVFSLKQQVPTLLKCGHVCCNDCSLLQTPCPCCRAGKTIIHPIYKRLLAERIDYSSFFNKYEQNLYDFNLSISTGGKTLIITNQKLSATIQSIMTQFDDFVQYQKVVKSGLGILIRSKPYFYHEVKDKPISQFSRLLFNNKKKQSNPIIVVNRNLGGN